MSNNTKNKQFNFKQVLIGLGAILIVFGFGWLGCGGLDSLAERIKNQCSVDEFDEQNDRTPNQCSVDEFDEFAKKNNLNFPPDKYTVYEATLDKFIKCIGPKDKSVGDLSHYFKVLTHLKMKEKCRLKYEIIGDSFASKPMINLDNIIIDKSPEGAWEAVLLSVLGDQFNLIWHAGYSQRCIVTNWRKFYNGRPADEVSGKRVCTEVDMKTLSSWDITPKVEINDDETATVYYCIFNAWNGFRRVSQRVHFDTGKLEKPVTLEQFYYNCRIRF